MIENRVPRASEFIMSQAYLATRWRILLLLFLVRTTMAVQFQMVATLSPAIEETFAVSLADVGVLIGLYFAPGIFIAAPGGALGRTFGEKRCVLAGLALMILGGALMVISEAWSAQLTGRFVSGIGGVVLNVLLTKMVADWFAGREISFAMAVFVNSWPVGIAIALVGLPFVAVAGGLAFAMGLVTAIVAAGFAGLLLFYRAPADELRLASSPTGKVRGVVLWALLSAGAIWGLYNAALAIVFSFGPQLFVSRGMTLTDAGSLTSLILWCLAIVGTVAGYLADRSGRRLQFIALGNLGFGFCVYLASLTGNSVLIVLAMGIFSGVAVGAMVSLPSLVLAPEARAFGMGIFFTVYYVCIAAGPMIAGGLSEWAGLAAAFQLAAILLFVTVVLLPLFHWLSKRTYAQSLAEYQPVLKMHERQR
jgi:MFS family permease